MLTIPAYAKINLTLEVLGKRPDGYHEIASVLQTIDLADSLSFELEEGIHLESNIASLSSPDNLVIKAAELLREATGCNKGALIRLTKGIPVAAGLGGGSSDAATTLQGLNELWGLGLSLESLLQIAPRLGSDVAFFLHGGTAKVEGRGEKVTPLPTLPKSWVVMVKPAVAIPERKTEKLYAELGSSHFSQGQFTKMLVNLLIMVEIRGESVEMPSSFLFNAFEGIAFDFFPGLAECRSQFSSVGVSRVHLAGTGPTLFTLVPTEAQGMEIRHRLLRHGLESYLCETIDAAP